MIELYSVKDVSRLFGLSESRLRYWISSGFLWPSVRRKGQVFYTFEDLITIKTAVELLGSGRSLQQVRAALVELRRELPEGVEPQARLRICSDGNTVVVVKDDIAYEPKTKQLVMAFEVASLSSHIADVLPLHGNKAQATKDLAVPEPVERENTIKEEPASAYQLFLYGCQAEENGAWEQAEKFYRQCLEIEGSMAAGHTNLGNLLHRQGRLDEAKACYEEALIHEPEQPEARFNLGNLLGERGQTDLAIVELRHVCSRSPSFADAHYNLGLLLAQVGGHAQAKEHLEEYLKLDSTSPWADAAREFLTEKLPISIETT